MVRAQPEYPAAFRIDCTRNTPISPAACAPYLTSDRIAGFHLVWAHDFAKAQLDTSFYEILDGYQKAGECCGFGPPLRCSADSRPPPNTLLLEGVGGDFVAHRQSCGVAPSWYSSCGAASFACSQAIDPAAAQLSIGGCMYEMPLGTCKIATPTGITIGCAATIEDSLNETFYLEGTLPKFDPKRP